MRAVRDGKSITIHSDSTKTVPGSRHYIHAEDVADAILFLTKMPYKKELTWGNAKCQKFNIVGSEELNNLELSKIISDVQQKELKYEMVDYHSSRPGHDLRYALSGENEKAWMGTAYRSRLEEVIRDP